MFFNVIYITSYLFGMDYLIKTVIFCHLGNPYIGGSFLPFYRQ